MPSISQNFRAKWINYHLTCEGRYLAPGQSDINGTIRETAQIHCADISNLDGPRQFASTASILQKFVKKHLEDRPLPGGGKIPAAEACVSIGRGWSFSKLVGARDLQIDLTGLAGINPVVNAQLDENCPIDSKYIALTSGGTRLRELVEWARTDNKSIMTSGTHLGLTVAGGFGTGSHGSRLEYGGIQNMILGMHIVTGPEPNDSVWIERADRSILNDATIASFAGQPAIRDNDVFEDALIHLGGMGIVNGVAMELVEDAGYSPRIVERPVDVDWLKALEGGKYTEIAAQLGQDGKPVFYEMTIDPFGWNSTKAIHLLYMPSGEPIDKVAFQHSVSVPDALALASTQISHTFLSEALMQIRNHADPAEMRPPPKPLFELYRDIMVGSDIFTHTPDHVSWADLHQDEITGGLPGSLYNASFAINRSDLSRAIPPICAAVLGFPPTFLYTVRFVSNPSGTMAFTRFPETAVIEIDGLSDKVPGQPAEIGKIIVAGAKLLRGALDKENIDYSMHWAKLGGLDANKVINDFGPINDNKSKLARWRATRELLLEPRMRNFFWNDALVEYGLV